MHRIDTSTKKTDQNGTGKDGFTGGTPGVEAATVVGPDWLNAMQEELAGIAEGTGLTLDKSNRSQASIAIEVQRCMSAIAGYSVVAAGGYAAACWSSSVRSMPPVVPGATVAPARFHAAVKTNSFLINGASAGSTTGALTAVAFKHGGAPVAVAIGSDGKMYRFAIGSFTNATISGSPDLRQIAWDNVNSLWWAVGPGGIYKAADATTPTFTQVSSTRHDYVLPLPSGRVLFYRPSGTQLYYTDNTGTSLVAGASSVPAFSYPQWDASNGQAVAVGTSGHLITTTNGTAITTSSDDFKGAWAGFSLFTLRGRVFILWSDSGNNEGIAFGAYLTQKLSTTLTDWASAGAYRPAGSGTGVVAGCGEFAIWPDATNLNISATIADLTGTLAP